MVTLPSDQEEFLTMISVEIPPETNPILIATVDVFSDYLKADRSGNGLGDTIEEYFPTYDILRQAYGAMIEMYFICLGKGYQDLCTNIVEVLETMHVKINHFRKYE